MKKTLKTFAKWILFASNKILAFVSIAVVPHHYYVPLANIKKLAANKDSWNVPVDYTNINYDRAASAAYLHELKDYCAEVAENSVYEEAVRNEWGPGYGPTEAVILHGVIRQEKPTRILEIGSGVSTKVMLHALDRNHIEGKDFKFLSIDPNPRHRLRETEQERNNFELLSEKVEEVDVKVIRQLNPDFLFIDSSHAVRPTGDVSYIVSAILPHLNNCLIHVHDIFFPYLFQRNLLQEPALQWMESLVLYSYLTGNSSCEVVLNEPDLFYEQPAIFSEVWPGFHPQSSQGGLSAGIGDDGHFPSSFYFRQHSEDS